MILEKETAATLLKAMATLDTIGAKINVSFHEAARPITVSDSGGFLRVQVHGTDREVFASRKCFEEAYELNKAERPVAFLRRSCVGIGMGCGWEDASSIGQPCKKCGELIPF